MQKLFFFFCSLKLLGFLTQYQLQSFDAVVSIGKGSFGRRATRGAMEFYVGARLEVVLERLEAFDECGATFCWAGFEKNRVAILLQVLYAICVGVLLRAAFTFKLKAF